MMTRAENRHPRGLLARLLRRAWRRQEGASTVEFAILVPLFMALFLAGVEAGIVMTRHAMLERGLDLAMRQLRLGRVAPVNTDTLRSAVCSQTVMIPNCQTDLLVELRRLPNQNPVLPADTAPCVNRAEQTVPAVQLTPGVEHDLILVRVCLIYDPLFPTSGWGLGLPVDASGGFRMAAASAYVNEPR